MTKPRYAIKAANGKYLYSGVNKCIFVKDLFIAKEFPRREAAERYAKKMNDAYYKWANSTKRSDYHFPVHVIAMTMVEIDLDNNDDGDGDQG